MIAVQNLEYTYAGAEEPALQGLNFRVQDGEVFGFLGPSGAGKSTTQKVLIGLLDDYEGQVKVIDREVRDWGPELYERIGVSAETPNLYRKLTGRENLELFAALYGGAAKDSVKLFERVGMNEAVDRRVGSYSKGMQMRLNFIRALVHEPDLVFLDEPTAGIDPGNARAVKNIIEDIRHRGATVFLTTHDMAVADQLCDRVALIVDGQLAVVETPRTLKLDHGEPTVRVEYRTEDTLHERTFPLPELGANVDFRTLLEEHTVETIHTTEATLEDVFIELTGTKLT